MHSKIFQINCRPISKDERMNPNQFYDNSWDFADYIGDEVKDESDRKRYIDNVASMLEGVFTLNDDYSLTYMGEDALRKFLEEWADELRCLTASLCADNILKAQNLWKVRQCCTDTHKGTSYRFYIEKWNGWAGPFENMIDFAHSQLKKGDRIYVGAIIDYHY